MINRNSFKLIGIRPHSTCHHRFTKVLNKGSLYKFYNEYDFCDDIGNCESEEIRHSHYKKRNEVPEDLYDIDNLSINISALVGKNGSGKSTLIELLLYSVYILGTSIKEKSGVTVLKPHFEQLEESIIKEEKKVSNLQTKRASIIETLNDVDNISKEQLIDELGQINTDLKRCNSIIEDWKYHIVQSKDEHNFIHENLHCSIYFEIGNVLWEYDTHFQKLNNIENLEDQSIEPNPEIRNIKILNIVDPKSSELLSSFFYTIILNYSHHSLNSDNLGYWITTLFHKNDGYKTPAVINPMRTDGYFKINVENKLAKARLLTNLLTEAFFNKKSNDRVKVTEKQYIHTVRFVYDDKKGIPNNIRLGNYGSNDERENFIISANSDDVNLIMELLPLYFQGFDEVAIQNKTLPYAEKIINYLAKKIRKALDYYPEYNSFENYSNEIEYYRNVLQNLKDDKSHVTFKIERAMFYLKKMLGKSSQTKWNINKAHVDFTLFELLDWMEIHSIEDLHLISERIPPSIFETTFILDDNEQHLTFTDEELKTLPTLESLSSGEVQKIHTINSIIYHINNLYSVHNSNNSIERIKYQYLNVVFDEIELYFHPDLQREFINDLLNNISRLKYITQDENSRIKAINFIFSTHSPFILSDIPSQNLLKVEYIPEQKIAKQIIDNNRTFGANIHDLLANSFFFKNKTFVGEKANQYILKLISEIASLDSITSLQYDEFSKKVQIIGEPFFRQKLMDKLLEISELKNDEKIDLIIQQKRDEIKQLEILKDKKKNDFN